MKTTTLIRKDLVYPELSYQVIGCLFAVWTKLGCGYKENFYQRAIAQEFTNLGLKFKEQLPVKISYKGKVIGIYYFDFLLENKIVLEVKVRNYFSKKNIEQLYSY